MGAQWEFQMLHVEDGKGGQQPAKLQETQLFFQQEGSRYSLCFPSFDNILAEKSPPCRATELLAGGHVPVRAGIYCASGCRCGLGFDTYTVTVILYFIPLLCAQDELPAPMWPHPKATDGDGETLVNFTALGVKPAHGHGGYDSDFSDEENGEKSVQKTKSIKEDGLLIKPFQKAKQGSVVHRQFAAEEWDREEARKRRFHLIAMDAYQRHKKFVNDYILYYGGKIEDFRRSGANDKTDLDVIRENHRFLWNEDDEADMNWEKRLAKKYYDKLFKEYCIADLSRYKENKFGFRWRHEKEVISGKGQFSCGNKHCDEEEGLKSWEVNFGYVEHGEKRNALVKLRLCPECSYKLNFHHRRKEVKAHKKRGTAVANSNEPKVKKTQLSCSEKKSKKKTHKNKFKERESLLKNIDAQDGPSDADFWKGALQEADEKSREEEFDEYFQDLFL
ncbi:PREDICTED: protein FRA10AC1 [Aptenodytes forsteri]|uniref:protein FRA10AC1 n=1 Tax=Aptenodytes forsteri TaxID=9233 RepID=UPI0004F42DC3|nr:PREDICTED: protein FRA10AC1 [Aptenodytes forsteri]